MKFLQFECPICKGNNLEVIGSIIDESVDPAMGYILFDCNYCGNIFEEEMEAIVEA